MTYATWRGLHFAPPRELYSGIVFNSAIFAPFPLDRLYFKLFIGAAIVATDVINLLTKSGGSMEWVILTSSSKVSDLAARQLKSDTLGLMG